MKKLSTRTLLLMSLPLCISAVSLKAQAPGPELSAVWGAMQYDASGTGTTPMVAVRGAMPLVGSWLLGEANFSYAALGEQFIALSTKTGIAEGQLQFQVPLARVRPYLGLGGGWLHYFNNADSRDATTPTFSGAAGMRFGLSPRFGARAELRIRGWGPRLREGGWGDSAAEWTGGLTYTF